MIKIFSLYPKKLNLKNQKVLILKKICEVFGLQRYEIQIPFVKETDN